MPLEDRPNSATTAGQPSVSSSTAKVGAKDLDGNDDDRSAVVTTAAPAMESSSGDGGDEGSTNDQTRSAVGDSKTDDSAASRPSPDAPDEDTADGAPSAVGEDPTSEKPKAGMEQGEGGGNTGGIESVGAEGESADADEAPTLSEKLDKASTDAKMVEAVRSDAPGTVTRMLVTPAAAPDRPATAEAAGDESPVASSPMDVDDSSPTSSGSNSKKRPRQQGGDDQISTTAAKPERLMTDTETNDRSLPDLAHTPSGMPVIARANPAADEEDAGGAGGDPRTGGGNTAAIDKERHASHKDTLKPVDDPNVKEVVSQDLATREIRRVRRKENDPPSSPRKALPSSPPSEIPAMRPWSGENSRRDADGTVANGAKPSLGEGHKIGKDLGQSQEHSSSGNSGIGSGGGVNDVGDSSGRTSGDSASSRLSGSRAESREAEKMSAGAAKKDAVSATLVREDGTDAGAGDIVDDAGDGSKTEARHERKTDVTLSSRHTVHSSDASHASSNSKKSNGTMPPTASSSPTTSSSPVKPTKPLSSEITTPEASAPSRGGEKGASRDSSPAESRFGSGSDKLAGIQDKEHRKEVRPAGDSIGAGEEAESNPELKGVPDAILTSSADPGGQAEAMEEDRQEEKAGSDKGKGGKMEEPKEQASGGEEEKEEKNAKAKLPPWPDHSLPSARAFFDFESVSSFEMRMLPEFFTGRSPSKTPEMYIQSRNFMVRSYERMLAADVDGHAYLTGTECRRKLAGDVCSILRIYDFLDRFGLINTRTGGKRPPSVQLPPPAMHVWSPTPPRRGGEPLFSREHRHGKRGAVAPERETGTGGGSSASGSMSSASAGSGSFAVDRRESPVQGWGLDAGEPGQQQKRPGHTRSDDREWHRQELVRLMEAAVARPNQWDVVAQQVGGGRTPAACMRRFLNLAVEDTLRDERDEESATANSSSLSAPLLPPPLSSSSSSATTVPTPAGVSPATTSSSAAAGTLLPSQGGSEMNLSDKGCRPADVGVGSGTEAATDSMATTPIMSAREGAAHHPLQSESRISAANIMVARGDGGGGSSGNGISVEGVLPGTRRNQEKRPAYLEQAPPALMLASALVSNVHPEVLKAAMSAATVAADDVARRSAASWICAGATQEQQQQRDAVSGDADDDGGSGDDTVCKGVDGTSDTAAGAAERHDEEDVEMSDAPTLATAAVSAGNGKEAEKSKDPPSATDGRLNNATSQKASSMSGDLPTVVIEAARVKSGEGGEGGEGGLSGQEEAERMAARAGAARAAVLSFAGLQARGLAELEERRTEALMADLLEARVQRLETKLRCLDELDQVLETERQSLEHDRAELLSDQARAMLLK